MTDISKRYDTSKQEIIYSSIVTKESQDHIFKSGLLCGEQKDSKSKRFGHIASNTINDLLIYLQPTIFFSFLFVL